MVDPRADAASSGSSSVPPGPEGLDALAVGARMSDQFIEMLGLWTEQLTALADVGVDPTPLLRSLARTLHSAADQLDPDTAGAAGRG